MEDAAKAGEPRAPWHLWVVGIVSVLWNSIGCYDYTMTNLRDPAYMAAIPPEIVQMIDEFPVWALGAWALGVWGAMAGSLLLLLRSRMAVHLFALSLLGLAGTNVYRFGFAGEKLGEDPVLFAIWAVALFLLWYAWHLRKRDILH